MKITRISNPHELIWCVNCTKSAKLDLETTRKFKWQLCDTCFDELGCDVKGYNPDPASAAVDHLIDDISERYGLGGEWDSISKAVIEEIKEEWFSIVEKAIENSIERMQDKQV